MREGYLEVTYRHGRSIAAYYYLARRSGDRVASTRRAHSGMLVDYAEDGRPIGIEITSPGEVTLEAINRVLEDLGVDLLSEEDLAPLHAA